MELISHLALGLGVLMEPQNIVLCFVGVFLGTLVGVLPGLGPTATISMLIPLTFALSPTTAVIMLAGIYYGCQYGGSTTAILLNLPGESSAAVTAIDGNKMAAQGKAGTALAVAALASFAAGTICTLAVALFAVPLSTIALKFNSADYFSLMLLGLIGSVALSQGSVIKSLAMVTLGLLLGLVGVDIYTGAQRFTMGALELSDGLSFTAVAMGMFGVAEILRNLERIGRPEFVAKSRAVGSLVPSREDARRAVGPALRGTGIGTLLGILPGAGATIAAFVAYALEKRISRRPQIFGHGAVEGVAAPEAANNAAAQSAFIPMLALGIPSTPTMAIIMGALLAQNFAPGPSVLLKQPEFFWGIVVSMWIGNLMLLVLNLPLIGLWVKLLRVPYVVLFPAVIIFCAIGTFSDASNIFDIYTLIIAGIGGYVLSKCDCEPAPLILGLVLGPLLEEHFRRALLVSNGDPAIFISRPISLGLLIATLGLLVLIVVPTLRRQRDVIVKE